MSLNISLPSELENRIKQQVDSGAYSSASEIVREALLLFEAYQNIQSAKLSSLKSDIMLGLSDINAGRVEELDIERLKQQGRSTLANKTR